MPRHGKAAAGFEREVCSDAVRALALPMVSATGATRDWVLAPNTWLPFESSVGIIAAHQTSQWLIWKCLCFENVPPASTRNSAKGNCSAIFGDIWWYLHFDRANIWTLAFSSWEEGWCGEEGAVDPWIGHLHKHSIFGLDIELASFWAFFRWQLWRLYLPLDKQWAVWPGQKGAIKQEVSCLFCIFVRL